MSDSRGFEIATVCSVVPPGPGAKGNRGRDCRGGGCERLTDRTAGITRRPPRRRPVTVWHGNGVTSFVTSTKSQETSGERGVT